MVKIKPESRKTVWVALSESRYSGKVVQLQRIPSCSAVPGMSSTETRMSMSCVRSAGRHGANPMPQLLRRSRRRGRRGPTWVSRGAGGTGERGHRTKCQDHRGNVKVVPRLRLSLRDPKAMSPSALPSSLPSPCPHPNMTVVTPCPDDGVSSGSQVTWPS